MNGRSFGSTGAPRTAAREMVLKRHVTATPEAFLFQQRKARAETNVRHNPMLHYARIRSTRYNMDARILQLAKMREDMEEAKKKRVGESQEEYEERMKVVEELEKGESKTKEEDGELSTNAPTAMKGRRVYKKDDEVGFHLNKLAAAVESEDQDEINRAVLVAYLEEVAKERLGEVDELLEKYKGDEESLFKMITEEHPLPKATDLAENEEDVEELKQFKKNLDKEYDEKNDGKFVLNMVKSNGGEWWVNKQPPQQHPSQRKRETYLPELRKRGNGTQTSANVTPIVMKKNI